MSKLGSTAVSVIQHSGFLKGLMPSELKIVLTAAKAQPFPAKSVIAHQEAPARSLFLLTQGRARHSCITPDGRKVILFGLVPGDIFGSAALLSQPSDYLVSTETVKNSCVLRWDRNTIRGLAAECPKLLENALSTASDYLTWYLATHLALIYPSARVRLAHVLSNLANGIGHQVPRGMELDVTNEELANAANLTVFTVSRILSQWQRQGAIVKNRGKVVVRSRDKLFLMV